MINIRRAASIGLGGRALAALASVVLCLDLVVGSSRAAANAWVQMTEDGPEARLVTSATVCPPILVDGRWRPMVERAGPTEAFGNRVCTARLTAGDRRVTIEGGSLRPPVARPNRIVIVGDSGCRLKGGAFQRCNDPAGWPFGRIAILAAARKPDLVIHVGDYYYREAPCPAAAAGCAGSPYGDRWPTWKAELFDPAAPLLAAAPWVFARGNHETCKRGGPGWFRLLDAAAAVRSCPSVSGPFFVDLGGVRLLMADSADTDDLLAPPDKVAAFAASLDPLRTDAGGEPTWIITHRPVWDSQRLGDLVGDGMVNATERQAVKSRDLSGVALVLSGHVHNFTSVSFGPARPPQLVVGTGGDTLDMDDAPPPTTGTARVDGLRADIFTMGRWGYFVLDRRGRDWVGHFYDTSDHEAANCLLHGRALTCRATRP